MLQKETKIIIIDNTPIEIIKCFGGSRIFQKYSIGDVFIGSVQKLLTKKIVKNQKKIKMFKKGQIMKVLILSVKYNKQRFGGIFFKSTINSGCLLNKDFNPIGGRVKGVFFREVSALNRFKKFLSISELIY